MLSECYAKAKQILTDNRDKLEALAQALLKQETLNRAEFVALMETGEIPEGLDDDKPRTAEEVIREAKAEQAETETASSETTETTETAETPETAETAETASTAGNP